MDIVPPQFGKRANGEPYIKLGKDHIGGHDCVVITSGPGTYEMLGQLHLLLGYLVGRRAARITLVSGYLPLCRSDKDEGALEFAIGGHTIHMIECAAHGKLDRIISVDLHAPQTVQAASHMGVITEISLARRLLAFTVEAARHVQEEICLLLPDDGAAKRFEEPIIQFMKRSGIRLPIIYGVKRRSDSQTSKFLRLSGDTDKLVGSIVIGLDDEVATGGTNRHTAEAVKNQYGAKSYWAVAVHGVLCENAPIELNSPTSPIDRIVVTDTLPIDERAELAALRQSGRLQVVSWAPDLAHLIFYHHWDMSIREIR